MLFRRLQRQIHLTLVGGRSLVTGVALILPTTLPAQTISAGLETNSHFGAVGDTAGPLPLTEDKVTSLFEEILGREPTPAELAQHVWRIFPSGQTTLGLESELRQSDEFRQLTPEIVVQRAFRDLFHRDATNEEPQRYQNRLVVEKWSPGMVRDSLRGQKEYVYRKIDPIIRRAYYDLLERPPDRSGRDRYRELMLNQGYSARQVRASIRKGTEYRETLPNAKITAAYLDVLGREPDSEGLKHYRKKWLASGWTAAELKETLRQSPEFQKRAQAEKLERVASGKP